MTRTTLSYITLLGTLLLLPACGGSKTVFLPATDSSLNFMASDEMVNTNLPGTSDSQRCRVCCSGLDVYVVWNDDRSGTDAIYFNVSRDGGRTWGNPDIQLNTGIGDVGTPEICCSDDFVYVTWNDDRNGIGDDDGVFVNVSEDRGATWLTQDIQVDAGLGDCDFITICCDGRRAYLAWEDDRNGPGLHDIGFSASADGGLTWEDDIRLNTNPLGLTRSRHPQLCCEGANVYAVWTSERDGEEDIYVNYSLDGGLTFLPSDVRIDGSAAGVTDSESPRICCDLPYVYVAWEEEIPGVVQREDILFDYSPDGGVTWQTTDIRVDTDLPAAADSERIDMCCSGTEVALVWVDNRGGTYDVYFSRSVNAGASWLPEDVRLSSNSPGNSLSETPKICCVGSSFVVTYLDDRAGQSDPWVTSSTDGGATWDAGFRANQEPGIGNAFDLDFCCDGAYVYVAWSEDRIANSDVFVNGSIP